VRPFGQRRLGGKKNHVIRKKERESPILIILHFSEKSRGGGDKEKREASEPCGGRAHRSSFPQSPWGGGEEKGPARSIRGGRNGEKNRSVNVCRHEPDKGGKKPGRASHYPPSKLSKKKGGGTSDRGPGSPFPCREKQRVRLTQGKVKGKKTSLVEISEQ